MRRPRRSLSRGRAAGAAAAAALLALVLYYLATAPASPPPPPPALTSMPNTTAPSYFQLAEEIVEAGNLTLASELGGRPADMSSFFRNLTLANSSSPALAKYLEWLQGALSPGNDSLYRFTFNGVDVQPPAPGVPVRYGIFNLPFGAQVVVLAYPSQSGLIFVLDGRIANQSAWLQALARVATAVEAPDIVEYSPAIDWVSGDVAPFYTYLNTSFYEWRAPLYTSYALWRVELQGEVALHGGYWVPVTVVVLLEEPIYTYNSTQVSMGTFWSAADLAFWDVVGAPTLALAVNIEYAGVPMPQVLYYAVPTVLWHTLHFVYSFYGSVPLYRNDYTPFAIEYVGSGVCSDQSYATASFVADALGAASAFVVSGRYAHAISLLVFPPQFAQQSIAHYGAANVINLTRYNASGAVIDNTDPQITPQMVQETIDWHYTVVFYPFADSVPVAYSPTNQSEANALLYTGIPEALYQLPPMFQFPWTRYYIEGFNLSALGQQYEEQFAQMVRQGTNLTGTRLYGIYIPSNISEWTVADYYQFALNGLYQELELGNGIVQAPSLSYLP